MSEAIQLELFGTDLEVRDLSSEFRKWEETHNRDNYGRFDAFAAGYRLDTPKLVQEVKTLKKILQGE